MARTQRQMPVRDALTANSVLRPGVQSGIDALRQSHRKCLARDIREFFADSLDLDSTLRAVHPQENRWDYLLGHAASANVIGLEPHSARQDQINTVIRKKEAARQQLTGHLRPGKRVSNWLWVASGTVQFADTEAARRRLDESGIQFVGRQVLARHLP